MHPLEDLSAYLDGELDGGRRAAVESHLAACDSCRTRLAQLRATARLIAALPLPVPARSLVPRVAVPIWLAPLRTLATIGSGAALFLFIASALTTSFTQTSSGGAAAPALAPQPEQVQSDRARGIASAGPSGAAGAAGPAGPSGPSVWSSSTRTVSYIAPSSRCPRSPRRKASSRTRRSGSPRSS